MKRKWKKFKPIKIDGEPRLAKKHDLIAIGFGDAVLKRDGRLYKQDGVVYDGDKWLDAGLRMTVNECELVAAKDPDRDWRIVIHGPLYGETYQRHGKDKWVCIESNRGFA